MSSTYAHYQGPSSLPSDYALLSRVAGNHNGENESLSESDDSHDTDGTVTPTKATTSSEAAVRRRESFPERSFYRPTNPTIGVYPEPEQHNASVLSEHTPLLAPPPPTVPRIEEEIDRDPAHDNDSKMAMFWDELPILTKYALPVFGTHLLEYTLVIVPVISIGHISTTALAAISLGSMTASVSGFSIIQGFASALDTMLPSAWTSSHPQYVGLWAQRMCVVMTAMLIPIFLIWFSAESILLFLRQDPDVAHLAAVYLRWVSLGLPAYTFNCISRRYFQSQGLFMVPTRIIFVVAPINAFLGWLLVWGPEPFRLGFIGAPLASAISFNLIAIASFVYGAFFVDRRAWHPLSKRMFTNLGLLAHLGLSGVGQTASEWWAWELVSLAASLLGPMALATQSVLLVSASTTFQAPFALSVATSVRIGNLLGERKAKRAGVAASTALVLALFVSVLTSLMFMVLRNVWGRIFNDDEEVIALVADIIPLVALFQVFDGNSAVTSGILRSRGKQFTGAILNLSAYYFIGVPFGVWLAFSWHQGLHGLWYGLTVSLIYCSVIGTWLCLKTDWDHEVDKVQARLAKEDRQRHAEMNKDDHGGERGDVEGYGATINGGGTH
ncbi:hypothetical protein D9611_006482 [Ephemerocybe angulata]|uniref:Multidrug and toxin extrusion protein n=1 Tax=Ephemerocybe angulata TaxID=980116 RepID=A0A8H5C705_9AGAR|nr:hypothetical protein D9611_006482 [Tulosesus angulatus]